MHVEKVPTYTFTLTAKFALLEKSGMRTDSKFYLERRGVSTNSLAFG